MIPPPLKAPAAIVVPKAGWSVVVEQSIDGLAQHAAAWDDLAANAVEPNVFFESWMLLPALRAFGAGISFRFVLIFRPHPTNPKGASVLCGFFPFATERRYKWFPIRAFTLWSHPYGLLGTPLVRSDAARKTF